MHKPSTVSPPLLCYKKGEQRLLKKRETEQISTRIQICWMTFLTRHAVTSRYRLAHLQKCKTSGLVLSK